MSRAIDPMSHTARLEGHLEGRLEDIAGPGLVVRHAEHGAEIIDVAEQLARKLAHFKRGRRDLGALATHSDMLHKAHAMMRQHSEMRDPSELAHPLMAHEMFDKQTGEAY